MSFPLQCLQNSSFGEKKQKLASFSHWKHELGGGSGGGIRKTVVPYRQRGRGGLVFISYGVYAIRAERQEREKVGQVVRAKFGVCVCVVMVGGWGLQSAPPPQRLVVSPFGSLSSWTSVWDQELPVWMADTRSMLFAWSVWDCSPVSLFSVNHWQEVQTHARWLCKHAGTLDLMGRVCPPVLLLPKGNPSLPPIKTQQLPALPVISWVGGKWMMVLSLKDLLMLSGRRGEGHKVDVTL